MAKPEQELTTHANNSKNGLQKNQWSVDEKKALAAVTFPLIEMQKAYGRQMNAKIVMQGWEIKFAGRFTIEQLLFALDKYTDEHDDFPSPSNLIAILDPKEPEVTTAQYIAAQDWQKRNNYPSFSDAKDIIERYERQQYEKRENYEITCEKVKQIAAASVNRINQIADNSEKSGDENPIENQPQETAKG